MSSGVGAETAGTSDFAQLDVRATAFSGLVLIVAVIVAWLVPFVWLAAIAVLAYMPPSPSGAGASDQHTVRRP